MAAKKNSTPPDADQPAVASDDSQQGTDTPAGQSTVPPSEEQRIRNEAAAKLEQRAGDAVVRLAQAEALALGLRGELDRERSKTTVLEQKVTELQAALAEATTAVKNAGTAIAGLPSNARQLNECVTIASSMRGIGKGGRLHAKAGDVLLVGSDEDFATLQQELGLRATVYRVSKDTLEDLERSGFLHS